MRKMKKAARLGASAVPMLHPKNRSAVVQVIYTFATDTGQHDISHCQRARFCYSKKTKSCAYTPMLRP